MKEPVGGYGTVIVRKNCKMEKSLEKNAKLLFFFPLRAFFSPKGSRLSTSWDQVDQNPLAFMLVHRTPRLRLNSCACPNNNDHII